MNNIIKNTIKIILFLIPAISMVVVSDMYFPFITGKNFLFRVVVELVLCLYIALAFADKTHRPRWSGLLIAFASFVGVMFVADIFAVNPTKAIWSNFERMEGFVMLAHLFAYFLVLVSVLRDKKDWIVMLLSTVSVSIFMTFFAFLQLFGGATINQGGIRLDGTLGNSAYMATYMVFHIFFMLYLWMADGNRIKGIGDATLWGSVIYIVYYLGNLKWGELSFSIAGGYLLVISILLALKVSWFRFGKVFSKMERMFTATLYSFLIISELAILYFTATRGATLGFLGGVTITTFFITFTNKENKKVRNIAICVLVFLFLSIGCFIAFRKANFIQNSPVLSRFANISLNDKSQARATIWPMAIEAFKENPIFGWGQDNFLFAFAKYYKPEMIRHEPWFDRTHNAFLDWLVAGGILGFVGYISLYLFALREILKSIIFEQREKAVIIGLLFAYGFLSLFIFDNLISYYLFILLLGLCNLRTRDENKKYIPEKISGIILLTMVCVFALLCFFVNFKPYKQNITLTGAISNQKEGYNKNLELIEKAIGLSPVGRFEALEQMINISRSIVSIQNVPDKDKSDFVVKTFNQFDSYIKNNPEDIRGVFMIGTFLADIGLYNDAIPFLEKSRLMSPQKQQIYYSLAKAYFIKADNEKKKEYIDQGIQYLKSAYEFAPDMDDPKYIYLNALVATDRLVEAKEVLKTMAHPENDLNKELVLILKQKKLLQ
jgi:hypothetical protein